MLFRINQYLKPDGGAYGAVTRTLRKLSRGQTSLLLPPSELKTRRIQSASGVHKLILMRDEEYHLSGGNVQGSLEIGPWTRTKQGLKPHLSHREQSKLKLIHARDVIKWSHLMNDFNSDMRMTPVNTAAFKSAHVSATFDVNVSIDLGANNGFWIDNLSRAASTIENGDLQHGTTCPKVPRSLTDAPIRAVVTYCSAKISHSHKAIVRLGVLAVDDIERYKGRIPSSVVCFKDPDSYILLNDAVRHVIGSIGGVSLR